MIPWMKHLVVPVGFSLLLVAAVPAAAGPLDPTAFAPVGPFPTAAGTYTFDTSTLTLNAVGPFGPGPTLLTGVDYNGIAVFDFSSITVNSDQMFVGTGTLHWPCCRGVTSTSTERSMSVPLPPLRFSSNGGPGGFGSDPGPAGGNGGEIPATGASSAAPVAAVSAAAAGTAVAVAFVPGNPNQVIPFGGGRGGSSYGDLSVSLQGGSGGGFYSSRVGVSPGGGGGGAIELGAVSGIAVRGSILANGGQRQRPPAVAAPAAVPSFSTVTR